MMAPEETYRRIVDGWNAHDPEAVAAQYAAEAEVFDPSYPDPIRGREAIVKDFRDTLASFPDIRVATSNILTAGGGISFQLRLSGTNTGPLISPGVNIPATGNRAEWDVGVFARVNERGQVLEEKRFYDQVSFLQQLGIGEPVTV